MITPEELYTTMDEMDATQLTALIINVVALRDNKVNQAKTELASKAVAMYTETTVVGSKMYTKAEVCNYLGIHLRDLDRALKEASSNE